MAVFNYHADKQGKTIRGTVKAANLQMANMKIKAKGMEPVYVAEKQLLPFLGGSKRVKNKDLMFVTRQLAFLSSAGLSLVQSLDLVREMTSDKVLQDALKGISQKVKAGLSFSKSLQSCPHIFGEFYVNMVACAEETGLMDKTLDDLAKYMEKAENIQSKIRSAMMYPIIVLSIAFAIISGIIVFVVPKFQALYGGAAGKKLPALTQLLVTLSEFFRDRWYVILAAAFFIPIFLIQYFKTPNGKKHLEQILDFLPLFGKLQYQAGLARFCRSFASLQGSGVNFLKALDVGHAISNHFKISSGLKIARDSVSQGVSFSKGLSRTNIFPPLFVSMTAIGEESGNLNNTFSKLADFYEMEVDDTVTGLIKLIEPIMITVLGGVISVIILALYLPVFKLGDII